MVCAYARQTVGAHCKACCKAESLQDHQAVAWNLLSLGAGRQRLKRLNRQTREKRNGLFLGLEIRQGTLAWTILVNISGQNVSWMSAVSAGKVLETCDVNMWVFLKV